MITHRGKTYQIPEKFAHKRPRSRTGLGIPQDEYNSKYRVLKGVRLSLVSQQRTRQEMLATLPLPEQQLVLKKVIPWPVDPFPFAESQSSRVAPRDPFIPEQSADFIYSRSEHVEPRPMYMDDDGQVRYKVMCRECGHYQRHSAFGPDRRNRNGLQTICKSCDNERKQRETWEKKLRAA